MRAIRHFCLLWLIGLACSVFGQGGIITTRHNLSVSGPGPVRAVSEERVCIFCHTPHGARDTAPLWNRRDSRTAYIPYNSPTLKARPGQPTGASKLCLSCHDGTIALGDLVSEQQTVAMAGSQTIPPGPGLIGTDLRDDHPISFNYFDSLGRAPGLTAPGTWNPRVKLDNASQLQCTTCHDPHDNRWGSFLVLGNEQSALCRQCHRYDFFDQTPHAESIEPWRGTGEDPWPHTDYPDVRTNACLNCHMAHHAGGPEELLTHVREEDVCYVCHNGNVARDNLEADFRKRSHHPVEMSQGVHQAGESPLSAAGHVECADCHNPHRARTAEAMAPRVMGTLEGVSGVDALGAPVAEAVYEYQVCFKCHAREGTRPIGAVTRQIPTLDLSKKFLPTSPSYHPVEAPGRNPDVPSLISPLTPASLMYCSTCHNNDQAAGGAGGSAGPHGSNYDFILVRQYRTGDNVSESPTAYALCYECHSRSSILANQSFALHSRHIVEERTPCSVCHDAHGIDFGEGNAVNNAHLINFDVSVVRASTGNGMIEYRSLGVRTGQCTLVCHGVEHTAFRYP